MEELFTAFYPTPPPWFGSAVDWDSVGCDINQLHSQMSTLVVDRETPAFHIQIARDGEILLRDTAIEGQIAGADAKGPDFEDHLRCWGRYLEHLNAIFSTGLEDSHKLSIWVFKAQ